MRRQAKPNGQEPEKKLKKEQKIKNELTEEQKREIKEAFSSFEEDGITPDELKSAMQALGFDQRNSDVQKILDKIDMEKGPLKYEQVVVYTVRLYIGS